MVALPFIGAVCFAQQPGRVTVSGLITDYASDETLIGAGVTAGNNGAESNNFGFYSLTLPRSADTVAVTYSYVGYEPQIHRFRALKDTVLNIRLVSGAALSEAVVTAQQETGISATKMSAIEVPLQIVKSAPALFGESDVIKTIQLLPGVQGGLEGFSGIYVRGGGPDENLLLLDGIPVYNAEHMLGIFSMFQPEAIKKMTLIKGAFPARYGGRISSIVDVRTNDGNLYETSGNIGISMLADKFHLEGPLWKGKTSYSISARGMHTAFLKPMLKALKFDGNYYFYDLDAKLTHWVNERNRLYLNVYNGMDNLHYKHAEKQQYTLPNSPVQSTNNASMGMRWGNTVAALRWNHILSGQLFSNTTLAYNRYRFVTVTDLLMEERQGNTVMDKNYYSFDYRSGMRDWVLKTDLDYFPSTRHKLHFGGSYTLHRFIPETSSIARQVNDAATQVDTSWRSSILVQIGHEFSLYAEDEIQLSDALALNPGVHASLFNTQGKSYWALEPRMSAKWAFAQGWSTKAAYSRMSQYVHLLSSSQMSLPIDLWVPITRNIAPEVSSQYSLGLYYGGIRGWEFSLEAYFKDMDNVVEYKDGVSFFLNSVGWENKVETGRGRAMGIELFVEKTMGKTTGWLGYTLSKSDRIFPTINAGKSFPFRYDRRHNINLVLNHRFSKKFDMSTTWTYASGGVTTLGERTVAMSSPTGEVYEAEHVPSRNNFRLPASHTLNLGFNLHKPHYRGESVWNLSIYNAYNHNNPFLVYTSYGFDENTHQEKKVLMQASLFPIIPSVSYSFKF